MSLMGLAVSCPSCKYTSKVPESYAGREVICPQCGNVIKVAGGTGTATVAAVPANPSTSLVSKTCPNCSRTVASSAASCIWCGTPLEKAAPPVSSEIVPQAGAMTDAAETRSCPYCAETIKAVARKCPHCGEILDPQLAATRRREARGAQQQVTVQADLEKKARDAFILSLVGLLCLGVILGPIAIIQGANVNRQLSQMGKHSNGLATTAIVMGILDLILFVVWIVIQSSVLN